MCVVRNSAETFINWSFYVLYIIYLACQKDPNTLCGALRLYSDSFIFYYINPSHLIAFECAVTKLSRRISRQFRNPFAIYRSPSQCLERQGASPVPVFINHTVMVATGPAETLNNPVCFRFYICTLKIYFNSFQFRTRMLCTLRMEWFYCISV